MSKQVLIHWPHGKSTSCAAGCDWLAAAREAGFSIPTGCLGGSCGSCEIDVNGTTIRACIATVPASKSGELRVELATDPYW
ncbi:MAG: 2Fe-2S iron-sulfur cluster binding domain-containing protein [Cyanobacteria bacterium K_DeepCast_35m_m1_288]|nr:2Fe-2S iron-sulfur cluster binding domain-containing protein [Cyanobacteria bacterium K_DeepCast_35m_m1_288]